jgi:hypothetical protein
MRPRPALLASVFVVFLACGTNVDLGGSPAVTDSGTEGSSHDCPGYAAPSASAKCFACSGRHCQPNGCYNGYYCKLATQDCQPPSVACGFPEGGLGE